MREKKRRAAMAAAASFAVLCLLVWVGCLPDLTVIPPVEAGLEGGTIVPQNVCGDGIIATLDDGGDAGESCDPGDAAVIGCRNCRLDCEDGGTLDPATGHCYFVLAKTTQYVQARSACRSSNAHLVTLGTTEEVELVAKLAGGLPYWVGLVFDNTVPGFRSESSSEPGFSRAPTSGPCDGCFAVGGDGGAIPPETDAGANCVVARADAGWTALDCLNGVEPLTTICEREPDGFRTVSCIGGFCFNVAITAGRKTYLLGVDSLTASEAEATCRSLDGKLAVLETVAEREQLAREIVLRYPADQETTYWLGLVADAGTWGWEDGVLADDAGTRRQQWGDRQPAAIDASAPARAFMRIGSIYDLALAYADESATTRRRYICERKPSP